ncbi:MAG: DUF885 domain-containing protein [Oscillospiraceae bacterium]|nr:DUF885 domain-containing protein [Oscillospiraceae bacterium]
MFYPKKVTAFILSAIVLISSAGCTKKQETSPSPLSSPEPLNSYQKDFENFLDEQFIANLGEDTLSLHYNLKNPEVYGLDKLPVTLGTISIDEMNESDRINAELYEKLHSYDIEKLTKRQQVAFRSYDRYLDIQLESTGLSMYQNFLSKHGGLQVNIPLLLAEYQFHSEKDVKDYLLLLADVPRYFNEASEFFKLQAENDLFIPNSGITSAVRQIKTFTSAHEDNILMTSFVSRIESLDELTDEEKQHYISENTRLVQQAVIPAFKQLGKDISQLKNHSGGSENGLYNLKQGKEYYKMLLRYKTGSDKTPEELFMMLNRHLTEITSTLADIRSSNPQAFTTVESLDFPDRSPETILTDLQEYIKTDFPDVGTIDYHVNYVPESLEKNTSPAFYMSPTVDNMSENSIYINQSSTKKNELFSTLAHEAYPGHMYQANYFLKTNPHPIMYTIEATGCKEGWASYCEELSYYLDPALNGMTDEQNLLILQHRLNLILGTTIDIGVNYFGWSVEDAEKFLSECGFSSNAFAISMFNLSATNPGYYPSYCIGTLEMFELREHAENKLGDKFDAKEFHHTVMSAGPAGFPIIEYYLDEYIQEKLADSIQQNAA